jgi:hypothetical protein
MTSGYETAIFRILALLFNQQPYRVSQFLRYIHIVTNSLDLSTTREATSCAVTRNFPSFLRKPKVHYRIHKSSPLSPILTYTNPVNTPAQCYLSQRFILISCTHLRLGLHSDLVPSGSPTNNLYAFLFPPIRATCRSNLIVLELIVQIILGEEYKWRSFSLCSFLHPPVTSSLFVQIFL